MRTRRRTAGAALAALGISLAAACGGGTPAGGDGGVDAGADAGTEPGVDAGTDGGAPQAAGTVARQDVVAGGGAAASPGYRGRFSVGGVAGSTGEATTGPLPQPIPAR